MGNLQLTVPSTASQSDPRTLTTPKETAAWVDDLPYANPLGTAGYLFNALYLLNRDPKRLNNRHLVVNCYVHPFHNLFKTVRALAKRQQTGTTHRKERKLARLVEKTNNEMAFGFKRAILEMDLANKQSLPPEITAPLIFNAIDSLSLQLIFSYARYQQVSSNNWKEILQLYLLAENLGVANTAVETPRMALAVDTNIRLIFKRIALIISLDPYRLQQNEIWRTFDYLMNWAPLALLSSFGPNSDPMGCFVIDTRGGQKIQSYDPDAPPSENTGLLMLDVGPLNVQVNKHRQECNKKGAEPILGLEKADPVSAERLLKSMLLSWHMQPRRRHPREERYDWLITASGINNVKRFIDGEMVEKPIADSHHDDYEITENVTLNERVQTSRSSRDTKRLRQFNVSLSGVGATLHPDEGDSVQVGQLVLMESERGDKGGRWVVGVVRRLILRDEETMEIGIQFVQGHIRQATVRPEVFGMEEKADFQPALLLERGADNPGVLLTPRMIYHKGREYVVEPDNGTTLRVNANKLLESTCCFDRFEYSIIKLHG